MPGKDSLQWELGLRQRRPLPRVWGLGGQWASRVEQVGLEREGA